MEILDSMDTSAFRSAFQRFEAIRGTCAYLRSDAGSNFMGARNNPEDDFSALTPELINEIQSEWQRQGKIWDVNPPQASHFGGVWERAIGQVRQIIQGYLVPRDDRSLAYDEFNTMLHLAARIVNSTPLGDASESPDTPQPITPHHLLTQRDDACQDTYIRPTIYTEADLLAYGSERWRRAQGLAEQFWKYWQKYMYSIGTDREKWTRPHRNASVGDTILLREKNLPRMDWSTGTITEVHPSEDGLVRKVTVQPHKRADKTTTEAPRLRAIHDLVLLKSLTNKDYPSVMMPDKLNDHEHAQVLLTTTVASAITVPHQMPRCC